MFRTIAFLILMPFAAWADISPRPMMFTYDATLDTCLADPSDPDIARNCVDRLSAAYSLKRAVAWAAINCDGQDFATCAIPFEDEGLPHIAVRIATDVGCDQTDLAQLATLSPLPENHCITVASDIMIDEGIVPLINEISCGVIWIECGDLADIHTSFWADQVAALAPDDATIRDLQARNRDECMAIAAAEGGWAVDLVALECMAERSAALWADLAQTKEGN